MTTAPSPASFDSVEWGGINRIHGHSWQHFLSTSSLGILSGGAAVRFLFFGLDELPSGLRSKAAAL